MLTCASDTLKEALIQSHVRDQSAFVPCVCSGAMRRLHRSKYGYLSAQNHSGPWVRGGIYWVASAVASAALRILPRYLPWLRCDALHPSAPDTTCCSSLRRRLTSLAKLRARAWPEPPRASRDLISASLDLSQNPPRMRWCQKRPNMLQEHRLLTAIMRSYELCSVDHRLAVFGATMEAFDA